MLSYRIKSDQNSISKQELIQQKLALEHQVMMDELEMEQELMNNTESSTKEAPNLRGNDKAGIVARDQYQNRPMAVG